MGRDQTVVLISTVLPGTVRRELAPLLKGGSLIYNPYLIAMGSVEWDLANPEMLIVGTADGVENGSVRSLFEFYAPLLKNDPRVVVGTWEEAESLKIFYNTFISEPRMVVAMTIMPPSQMIMSRRTNSIL